MVVERTIYKSRESECECGILSRILVVYNFGKLCANVWWVTSQHVLSSVIMVTVYLRSQAFYLRN